MFEVDSWVIKIRRNRGMVMMLVMLVLTSGKREGVEIGIGQVKVLQDVTKVPFLDVGGCYRVFTL